MAELQQTTVNWQVVFNPQNQSHVELMEWVKAQTRNRSSFIRETLLLRKMGLFNRIGTIERESSPSEDFDVNEIRKLIEVI